METSAACSQGPRAPELQLLIAKLQELQEKDDLQFKVQLGNHNQLECATDILKKEFTMVDCAYVKAHHMDAWRAATRISCKLRCRILRCDVQNQQARLSTRAVFSVRPQQNGAHDRVMHHSE